MLHIPIEPDDDQSQLQYLWIGHIEVDLEPVDG